MKYLLIKILIGGSITLTSVSDRYIISIDPEISNTYPISIIDRMNDKIYYFNGKYATASVFECLNEKSEKGWTANGVKEKSYRIPGRGKKPDFGNYIEFESIETKNCNKIIERYLEPKSSLLKKYCFINRKIDWRVFLNNSHGEIEKYPYLLETILVHSDGSQYTISKIVEYEEREYSIEEIKMIDALLNM